MRNYNDQIEAAYMFSKRQGNLMRDRDRERSAHEGRRNRYIDEEPQPGIRRYGAPSQGRQGANSAVDTYRPANSDYMAHPVNHRGKGPQNYKRSDERIKEIISDRLSDHPDLDASEIEVEVKDSKVFLKGQVF